MCVIDLPLSIKPVQSVLESFLETTWRYMLDLLTFKNNDHSAYYKTINFCQCKFSQIRKFPKTHHLLWHLHRIYVKGITHEILLLLAYPYTLRSKSLTWNIYTCTCSSGCNVQAFYALYMYIHANSDWLTIISLDS